MAKRRTKAQKNKAELRRAVSTPASGVAEANASVKLSVTGPTTTRPVGQEKSLLRVDPKLLKYDLFRSILISFCIVLMLIGIFVYLRYN